MEEKKLKILFCQTQFKMGGQQKVLLTIAKELSKEHEVEIYYENYNFFDLSGFNLIRLKKLKQIINLIKVLITHLFNFNFNKKLIADDWHLENLKASFRNRNDIYDVVILLNPYILFVKEIKELLNVKKVVCWTHNNFDTYVNNYFKFEQEKLFASMNLADQVVSLERYTAEKWSKYNDNTIIIHNPITISNKGKRANLESKKISFVGRLQIDMKGLDYLIEVAKLLPSELKIHIAGSGSSTEEKEFKRMIYQSKVEEKVILHGALKGEDLLEHYLDSFLLIMPSRYEGFPLVSVEAMSVGLPFIGFDIPSLAEVTDDGKYGELIEIGDVKKMAERIYEISKSKIERKNLSNKSLYRVQYFTLERIKKEWEKEVLYLK